MIERILRSPLVVLFFFVLLMAFVGSTHYFPAFNSRYGTWLTVAFFLLLSISFLLLLIHNKRHPSRKINLNRVVPYEFKEEDEGLRWVTFQACRKVYIFYFYAVPIGAALIAVLKEYTILPFAVLLFMGVCQYLIYWWEERKYRLNDMEEELD